MSRHKRNESGSCSTIIILIFGISIAVALSRILLIVLVILAICIIGIFFLCHRPLPNTAIIDLKETDSMTGYDFERWVAALLSRSGYSRVQLTSSSGDNGLDIIAYRGNVKIGMQCKCYHTNVGNGAVQEAYTGKAMYSCDEVIVVTNSYFTSSAKETARRTGVELWDRHVLERMTMNYEKRYYVTNNAYNKSSIAETIKLSLVLLALLFSVVGLVMILQKDDRQQDRYNNTRSAMNVNNDTVDSIDADVDAKRQYKNRNRRRNNDSKYATDGHTINSEYNESIDSNYFDINSAEEFSKADKNDDVMGENRTEILGSEQFRIETNGEAIPEEKTVVDAFNIEYNTIAKYPIIGKLDDDPSIINPTFDLSNAFIYVSPASGNGFNEKGCVIEVIISYSDFRLNDISCDAIRVFCPDAEITEIESFFHEIVSQSEYAQRNYLDGVEGRRIFSYEDKGYFSFMLINRSYK